MKFLGVISFLNAFPICAMPKGNVFDEESTTFLKFVNICCAVSGLRYANDEPSSIGPTLVLNIRLNGLGSVKSVDLHAGHLESSIKSLLQRALQALQSTIGSENVSSCPECLRTIGFDKIEASKPSILSVS